MGFAKIVDKTIQCVLCVSKHWDPDASIQELISVHLLSLYLQSTENNHQSMISEFRSIRSSRAFELLVNCKLQTAKKKKNKIK